MKNMKGRMVRKLKTISKYPPSLFQHKNHTSLPHDEDGIKEHEPSYPNMIKEEDKVMITSSCSSKVGEEEEEEEEEEEKECVVLYSTSLRGIRKTFEDCNAIRFLLGSFRVAYRERDVSMDLAYREELWRMVGGRVVPPRLFIRGRCIGGADEVIGLHEKGMLITLLQGIPLSPSSCPCRGCAGMGFLLCCKCSGSRRLIINNINININAAWTRCPDCNENGLIKCSLCT
ncbi:hypothetical protein C2S52_022069 [Perilla frutescens var. hirtella]|nr:hypothetical protein C2S52_022069 [Perilla frutescens var. hirtella]